MDGRKVGWTDGRLDGRTDGLTDRRKYRMVDQWSVEMGPLMIPHLSYKSPVNHSTASSIPEYDPLRKMWMSTEVMGVREQLGLDPPIFDVSSISEPASSTHQHVVP